MEGLTSLDLSDNEIAGIPNLSNIPALSSTTANLTENRLAFDDLQRQSRPSVINFGTQKKLLESMEVILEANQPYTVDRTVGGEGNVYSWTNDGEPVIDQVNGTIVFEAFAFEEEGKYEVTVTNPAFEGISLSTNPLQIFVSSLERDRQALLAVYTANGGTNWVGATGWPTAPIEQWAGVTITNSRVTAVNLSGFGLTGTIPNEFTTMVSVTSIDLSNNKIDGLPDFTRMTNLSSLDLSKNSLEFDAILANLTVSGFEFNEQAPITIKVEERVREGLDYGLSIDVKGDELSYQWYFNGVAIAGATTTEYSIEGINFETMGDYRCDIANATVSAVKPGFALSTGDFEILAIADIGGTVRTLQNQFLAQGTAVLYKVRPKGNPYDSVTRVPIVNGVYNFEKIVLGDYLVRYFGPEATFFPTYYSTDVTWSKADTIKRRKDDNEQYNSFILFNPPPLRAGPLNRNEVVGQLSIDDDNFSTTGRVNGRRSSRNTGVAFSRLRATNRGEEDVFELIAYVVTDENGEWEQPNLPDGTYQIVMEFPGIPMDESTFVEFELNGTGTVNGIKLILEAEILPDGIVVNKIATTGLLEEYFMDLNVYPNPTSQYLNISYERLNEQGLQWQVINLNGQQIMQGEVPAGYDQTVTLDVAHLNNGVYMLNIIDPANRNNKQVAIVRFIVRK
jgi:hypothetical protein